MTTMHAVVYQEAMEGKEQGGAERMSLLGVSWDQPCRIREATLFEV